MNHNQITAREGRVGNLFQRGRAPSGGTVRFRERPRIPETLRLEPANNGPPADV